MARSILEIIVQSFKRGDAIEDSQASLSKLSNGVQKINQVLRAFGLALGAKQAVDFANATREAARVQTDAIGALKTAATGIADYQQALALGRAATKGMASDQQIASSQATIFGAKLANSAQQAAQLASAGTILSQVFANAGASEELYVRLLSSGSQVLYNNFGLTTQMVEAKKREIEATQGLHGEEAKQQALKEILIAQAQKYQGALSAETVAATQAKAAQENFMAAFGNLVNAMDQATGATSHLTSIMNQMTDGAKAWQGIINNAIPAIYEYATSTDEQWAAAQKAEVANRNWVSSVRAMDIAATNTASSVRDLNAAQKESQLTNRESDAMRQYYESMGKSVEIEADFEKQQEEEKYRQKKQQQERATRDTENAFKKQTQAVSKAFDEVGSRISDAVGGAINDLAEVWNPGGETDAANGAAQWARRMAAVAAGGLKDEWANPERWANFGGDQSVLQPLFNAISSGDDAAVKAQAQALLANKTADLFDANMIAAQVEQKLRAQQIQQTLNDRVNALLSEKGLQAVTNVTQQVAGVAADTGAATTAVGESVAGLGTSAETSAAKIGESFTSALGPVDTLNARLKLMAGLIERVNVLAGQAAGNIAGMNPPAAPGGASDAKNKMGGNAPL